MKPIIVDFTPEQSTRLAELEAKRARVSAEANAIDEERRTTAQNQPYNPPHSMDPSSVRIAELLGEKPPHIEPGHREKLADMAQRSRDLRQVSDLLAEQIRAERQKAAVQARIKLAPEYRSRIQAVCEAFKSVHAANAELHQLTDAMDQAGIEWGALGHVGPKQVGSPRDPYGPVALYLRDALDLGFIVKSEIPKEFKDE